MRLSGKNMVDVYGKIIFAFICSAYLIVTIRLLHFQVLDDETTLNKTVKRYERLEQSKLERQRIFKPLRGNIYSRNGKLLATTLYHYRIFADGAAIGEQEKDKVAGLLSRNFGADIKAVSRGIENDSRYIPVARRVDARRVMHLDQNDKIEGVYMERDDAMRIYPLKKTASHVVGFVNYAGQATGVERSFDDIMRGVKAESLNQIPEDGADLYLTIDTDMQYFLEEVLEWGYREYRPNFISGIVMDPVTGEVIAMGNYPDFDPNRFYEYDDRGVMINRAVAHSFEPGSSFKIVTLAAAIEEGLVDSGTVIDCEGGYFKYKGEYFRDTLKNGIMDVATVYKKSSNVGVIKIADMVGRDKIYFYAKQFGFTEKRSIQLPNEASGRIRDMEKWAPSDLANISIGYGVATNLLRLTTAYAVIANGGLLPEVRIESKILYSDGGGRVMRPNTIRRVVSKETAAKVRDILIGVVDDGSASRARINGVKIAGKTGTAVKYDHDSGTYDYSRVTGTFVGFFPADNPRYVIGILVDEPAQGGYASTFAVPVFRKIAESIIRYEGI